MITVEFKSYGEALQPMEATDVIEALEIAKDLERKGYEEIEIVSDDDFGNYADPNGRAYNIHEINKKGEGRYLQALEETRREMFRDLGVKFFDNHQVFAYASDHEMRFDLNGFII